MPINVSVLNSTTGFGGMCLRFTRLVFGVPALYATAYEAWLGAQHKHPGDVDPPYGVPVFWAPHIPGGAGHVAPSLGGGLVRTTNSATGTIYTTTIKKITAAWGMPYLGWTEDLNGVRIWTPPAPDPVPTPTPTERDWFDMATEAELEAIVRRADFVRFWHLGARFEACMANGTYYVLQSNDDIERRADVLGMYRYVIEDWPTEVANPAAFGRRV